MKTIATSAGGRRHAARRLVGLAAVALAVGSAATTHAAPATNGGSFFDNFDKIERNRWFISHGWSNGPIQSCTWDASRVRVNKGILELTAGPPNVPRPGCAEIRTWARLGYGTYEARVRIAAGSGLNSAMFIYSGPPITQTHDEIDFEFLGKDPRSVQLNYFTAGRGGHGSTPALPVDGSKEFVTIAFEWQPQLIRWYIDGKLVRQETGPGLPYTPGQFALELWTAGPPGYAWLGTVDQKALPAKMEIDWIAYTAADESCRFPESVTCKKR